MLAGLTKAGRPRSSASSAGSPGVSSCSPNERNRACGIPAASVTCFAIALSIATAEPSTPLPTYGMSASSSIPWTVPSSPSGPWSSGRTTVWPGRRDRVGEHRRGRHDGPGRIEPARQGVGPGGERRGGAFGDRPLTVGRDPDRGDAVLRRIRRRAARGRPSCTTRRVRPIARRRSPRDGSDRRSSGGGPIVVHRPNGTVRPREDSGIGRGRRRGRAPDRTRRRIRRGIVRLSLDRSRASCSCRSWPSATATTSSIRRARPGRWRTSRAEPVRLGRRRHGDRGGRHVRSR